MSEFYSEAEAREIIRRSVLIEEAAKAILDKFHAPDDRHPSWWINPDEMARAALAVFEKAHTPKVTERHDLVMPIYDEPEPQDEPSDAQVLAALNAYGPESATDDLSDYHEVNRDAMRAALRAAGEVR